MRLPTICSATILTAAAAAACAAAVRLAVAADEAPAASRSAWRWYRDVKLPEAGTSPWVDFLLPPAVFDEAREDLGDLRLVDAAGREVPYALRIGQAHPEQRPAAAKEIAHDRRDDRSVEVVLDLGEKPGEHRSIDVLTNGNVFSRRVELATGDDGREWTDLEGYREVSRQYVVGVLTSEHRLQYPASKRRYLRVRVFPDVSWRDVPVVSGLIVYHSVEVPGESLSLPATLGERQSIETPTGKGSAWTIDLGGRRVPCDRLSFDVSDEFFSRAYYLERVDPGQAPVRIADGQWDRTPLEAGPVAIRFPERALGCLRLVVSDKDGPPLRISAARFAAPARQVVLARDGQWKLPLRLYAGNPQAEKPAYEIAAGLPAVLEPPPDRATLGEKVKNARADDDGESSPEERPWSVYAAAGAAGIILLAILVLLVRRPARRNGVGRRGR